MTDNAPRDRWWRPPVPPEQLARERVEAIELMHEANRQYAENDDDPDPFFNVEAGFTCDDCRHAPRCRLAFDLYNTDGDCLASK